MLKYIYSVRSEVNDGDIVMFCEAAIDLLMICQKDQLLLASSWLRVTEITESKTADKGVGGLTDV